MKEIFLSERSITLKVIQVVVTKSEVINLHSWRIGPNPYVLSPKRKVRKPEVQSLFSGLAAVLSLNLSVWRGILPLMVHYWIQLPIHAFVSIAHHLIQGANKSMGMLW
jgi:hypothetical protein